MLDNIERLIRIISSNKEHNSTPNYKNYHHLGSSFIAFYIQAQNARIQGDKAEIYYCLTEMEFLFDELARKNLLSDDQHQPLLDFKTGCKYFLLERKPIVDEAYAFVPYGGAKSTRQQAEELQKDIVQVAEEDLNYQKNKEEWDDLEREQRWKKIRDDENRRPHILP